MRRLKRRPDSSTHNPPERKEGRRFLHSSLFGLYSLLSLCLVLSRPPCMPCCCCPSQRASWSCLRPIFPGRRRNFVQAFKAEETEGTIRDLKEEKFLKLSFYNSGRLGIPDCCGSINPGFFKTILYVKDRQVIDFFTPCKSPKNKTEEKLIQVVVVSSWARFEGCKLLLRGFCPM